MKPNSKLTSYQAKQQILERRKARAPRDNRLALLAAGVAVAVAAAGQFIYFSYGPGFVPVEEIAEPAPEQDLPEPEAPEQNSDFVPSPELSENRSWLASIDLNGSPLELELFGDLAPQAVANYVSLVQSGFYENVNCHRLVTAGIFVLQCGDPDGNGTGGPGYNWGPIENAPADDLYPAGTLAMARRGGDGFSMGSQFFIVFEDSVIPSDAAGGYTVFGRVTAGLDAVAAIAAAGVAGDATDGSPIQPVVMSGLTVE